MIRLPEFFRRKKAAQKALKRPRVVTETDRLADILHSAGLNAFTHPSSRSGDEGHEYRTKIADFLIKRGVRLPEEETERLSFKIYWPLGMWGMDGNWHPNPYLSMSATEQYEHNIRNGYQCYLPKHCIGREP